MTKIRYKKTGKVMEVQAKKAKELVDKGEAEFTSRTPNTPETGYNTRQVKPEQIKTK